MNLLVSEFREVEQKTAELDKLVKQLHGDSEKMRENFNKAHELAARIVREFDLLLKTHEVRKNGLN